MFYIEYTVKHSTKIDEVQGGKFIGAKLGISLSHLCFSSSIITDDKDFKSLVELFNTEAEAKLFLESEDFKRRYPYIQKFIDSKSDLIIKPI